MKRYLNALIFIDKELDNSLVMEGEDKTHIKNTEAFGKICFRSQKEFTYVHIRISTSTSNCILNLNNFNKVDR